MTPTPELEHWPLDRLIPYARNPRRNDQAVKQIASAIQEYGFRVPILARSDGEVVDGHLRLKAAQALGLETVPVLLCDDMTEAQVKAFRISVNRMAELAEWDLELLALEVEELKALDVDLDNVLAGLELPMVETLPDGPEPPEPGEPPAEPITRPGDLWVLGRHRLLCGDSTSVTDVDRLLGGAKPDLCLTDPPYGLGDTTSVKNNYDTINDTAENLEELIAGFLPLAQSVAPVVVLTPGNANQRRYPAPTWTMAWFVPAGTGCGPWGFCCWQPILCFGKDPKLTAGLGRHHDAIVHTESAEKNGHPCPKPIGFWSWLMERTSEKGAMVYDPFLGSGTTLVAAEQLGRTCYGMEISPAYCDVIVKRWEEQTGLKATLEPADG